MFFDVEKNAKIYYISGEMLKNLTINNFRNHAVSKVNFDGAKNVIFTGPNGGGKTAILESLSLFAPLGSMRGANISDMVKIGTNTGFSVYAEMQNDSVLSVSVGVKDKTKKIRINGDASPIWVAAKEMKLIWLTPNEDRLFDDTATDRRGFLDRLVAGFDTNHSARITELNKLLHSRAFALKTSRDDKWLNSIESNLASVAVQIAAARIAYAAQINHFLQSKSDINIILSGRIESGLCENLSSTEIENNYKLYLSQNRELVGGNMVCDGVHKSDWTMFSPLKNMNADMMSAGQQKKLLLLLIIAHIKLLNSVSNTPVIVLLDEMTSYLDMENVMDLFARLNDTNAQVLITGAKPDVFTNIPNSIIFSCVDGNIIKG
ncbi:MAG: AAA family ATPase [Rickettsiales bacterium]|jgi:DNA replication and repair protein RecF|nr:AAA family ATPase [Rickettsiales bacterium]